MDITHIINKLKESMPPVFTRKELPKLLGGILTVGHICNLDSSQQGPPRMRLKRHVIYERDSFLEWFKLYLESNKHKKTK
jgi:hypothetical protein